MTHKTLKSDVEGLIAQGELAAAFDMLKPHVHDLQDNDDFIGLWGRLNQVQRDFNAGLIEYESYDVHRNRIRKSLLELIGRILSRAESGQREALSHHMNLGLAQMQDFDFQAAAGHFSRVIDMDAQHVQAHLERGVARMNLSNFSEALLDFSKAVELAPSNPFAHHNRGVAFFQLDNIPRACEDWKKVKALGFDISDALLEGHCG